MSAEAGWEADGSGGLRLTGDWRLRAMDQTLRRDARSLLQKSWTSLSLAGVTALDSATLAFLLEWQEAQRALGSTAEPCDLPPTLKDLLALYGLSHIWHGQNDA